MNVFEGVLLTAIVLAVLFALMYKGSWPPLHPIPPRAAVVASLIPIVCAAIHGVTLMGLDLIIDVRSLLAVLIIVIGIVVPWCVYIYYAYRATRAGNKVVRAIGSTEVVIWWWALTALGLFVEVPLLLSLLSESLQKTSLPLR